jgi:NitT/TauT family transport system ATP-binding protein
MKLACDGINLAWGGGEVPTLQDVSLEVNKGEFVAIIGPSGCGKTTLLYILSGLREPTSGRVLLNGSAQLGPAPGSIGMIFQENSLYPWLRVRDNIEFGMRNNGLSRTSRRETVKKLLERVGLLTSAAKFPHELSGGMKQRVSIARSLARNPEILLMDEPFAALDFQTRFLMQNFLLEVWEDFQPGIVFVTHYVDEAILLADRVLLMSVMPGRIVEDLAVTLRRPRDITSPGFNEYRTHVTLHLESEVKKLFALQGDLHANESAQ